MLKPFVRWAGGKSSEISEISKYFPINIENYYEPFVGGGSVYLHVNAKKYYINDKSKDLISLYKNIKNQDSLFIHSLEYLKKMWQEIMVYTEETYEDIEKKFQLLKVDNLSKNEFIKSINKNFFILGLNGERIDISKTIYSLLKRIVNKEISTGEYIFSKEYFETVLRFSFYSYIRDQYNSRKNNESIHSAYYFFILNYSFGGLSRYNKNGDFNVPYSGSYNKKSLRVKKLSDEKLLKKLKLTTITNNDFKYFFKYNKNKLGKNDFIFIDPPYDSKFKNYDNNDFS